MHLHYLLNIRISPFNEMIPRSIVQKHRASVQAAQSTVGRAFRLTLVTHIYICSSHQYDSSHVHTMSETTKTPFELFGHKPYARVRFANSCNAAELLVPLHWLHRPQLARRAKPTDELRCFISDNLTAVPYFRRWNYQVNVLQVVEGEFRSLLGEFLSRTVRVSNIHLCLSVVCVRCTN